MFARVVTFAGGDPTRVEEVIAAVRDRLTPGAATAALDEAEGFWMLVDRNKGRILGISIFEDRDALRRGSEALDKLPPPAPEAGGRPISVDVYEIPVSYVRSEQTTAATP
jgi:hypothetical protein